MKNTGGPVKEFPVAEKALQDFNELTASPLPDFSNTALTFSHLSDQRLLGTRRLFRLMGNRYLTRLMGSLGVKAVGWSLPGAEWMVRNTVYKQFVGGTHLEDAYNTIAQLAERGVYSILDFGAEGKATEEGMDESLAEAMRGTAFASNTEAVIGSVVKLTSLFPFALLEEYNDRKIDFNNLPEGAFKRGVDRLDRICRLGRERGCEIYLDAEESWIQSAIDQLAEEMMDRYNRENAIIFTTCQFYRHDRLAYMKALHQRARQKGFKLALKLVRGAYMVKERKRAEKTGKPSPIQPDIEATHRDFNAGAAYCLEHRDEIAHCIASHNEASTVRHITEMKRLGVPRNHPNIRFSQLLGMSDNLTFNLAEGGYNVSKYMVYGPVKEVLPYLVRRAQENTSVTGEAGRELRMLDEEVQRRGL
ncbi:proline dehydrogenase [Lewinella marina]|uniref:Proline dehydrogenase n=1 Tax=Neolewinella marina TaxID=438751 RepID=A0A2G0CHV7_9BACT|nr:proline dehydrogenase family protein [Neolewinella marina]NJB85319.1 proline dehydrogenase [Neolewinella marina]PHK99565.1 proline dehydrogenase [Neolewinella marina]